MEWPRAIFLSSEFQISLCPVEPFQSEPAAKSSATLTITHTSCLLTPVQLMPNIQVMCARHSQGRLSCWRAARADGIVKETF